MIGPFRYVCCYCNSRLSIVSQICQLVQCIVCLFSTLGARGFSRALISIIFYASYVSSIFAFGRRFSRGLKNRKAWRERTSDTQGNRSDDVVEKSFVSRR